MSPFVEAGVVNATRRGDDGGDALSGNTVAAGLTAGGTWRLGERVLRGLGFGGQYHRAAFDGTTAFPGYGRLMTTVDINLSWRF